LRLAWNGKRDKAQASKKATGEAGGAVHALLVAGQGKNWLKSQG
jgi:hypothetical protein